MMKKKNEAKLIMSAIQEWLVEYLPQTRSRSANTQKNYKYTLALYVDFLEQQKSISYNTLQMSDFSATNVEEWIRWMKNERKCGNSSCNNRLAGLKSFLKYMGHKDISLAVYEVDVAEVKCLKEPKKEFQEITQKGMKALLAVPKLSDERTGRRDYALFTLLYHTATRIDELLSLRLCDVHFAKTIDKNYVTVLGKGVKRRTIYVLPEIAKIMRRYMDVYHSNTSKDDDFLFFTTRNGCRKKMTQENVNDRLRKYSKAANEKCPEMPAKTSCHRLRHARASHWLEEGLNIVMIQKLLGHENLQTTMKYIGISNEQKAKALAAVEDNVAKNADKEWKKVRRGSSLAEKLGLR